MSDSSPHSSLVDALQGALSCNHKWKMNTYAETECEECGIIERWEGGLLIETKHPALTGLVEQLEAAHEALRFYADPENYKERGTGSTNELGYYEVTEWPVPDDEGETARAVLNPATGLPYPARHGSSLYDKDSTPATRSDDA